MDIKQIRHPERTSVYIFFVSVQGNLCAENIQQKDHPDKTTIYYLQNTEKL